MNAREFRAIAERCRELQRVAVRDDIREQLRQWAEDFEAEADAIGLQRCRKRKTAWIGNL